MVDEDKPPFSFPPTPQHEHALEARSREQGLQPIGMIFPETMAELQRRAQAGTLLAARAAVIKMEQDKQAGEPVDEDRLGELKEVVSREEQVHRDGPPTQ